MNEATGAQMGATICIAHPDGGTVLVEVPASLYKRYDGLRHQQILSKEWLGRLATHDGATPLRAVNVEAILRLSEEEIRERVAELQALDAVAGEMVDRSSG